MKKEKVQEHTRKIKTACETEMISRRWWDLDISHPSMPQVVTWLSDANTWPQLSVRKGGRWRVSMLWAQCSHGRIFTWQPEETRGKLTLRRCETRRFHGISTKTRQEPLSFRTPVISWAPPKCRARERRTFARKWQDPPEEFTRSAMLWWTRNWHSVKIAASFLGTL